MLPLLNWPKLDVPVIIGWYIDESFGVMMPTQVWNKPLADIDGKIKRYTPRNPDGWNAANEDMLAHGWEKGKIVSMRFWIEMALANQKLLDDEEDNKPMVSLMSRFGDPDVMLITGSLNNVIALLQFGTTWNHMLYQHGNIMPVSDALLAFILKTLKGFETTNFSKGKLKSYVETLMEEAEDKEKVVESLEQSHLELISIVVTRL